MVFHGHGLVDAAVVGVHPLEHKALGRVDLVVIGFFKKALVRQVIGIVLVRRVAGGVPGRRAHLHHQQRMGRLAVGQDVADITRVGALATHAAPTLLRADQPGRETAGRGARRGADGDLHIAQGGHLGKGARWQVGGERRFVFKYRLAITQVLPTEPFALDRDPATEQHQAQLVVVGADRQCLPQAQAVSGKPYIFQAPLWQRDHGWPARGAFDQQAHCAALASSSARKVSKPFFA